MKRDVEKRLARLESALLPKPVRPMIQIVTRIEDVDGNLTDAAGRPLPLMIMGRPGPAKADDPNSLTLTIIDTVVHTHGQAPATAADPEPGDNELAGAVDELEKRAKGGRPLKTSNPKVPVSEPEPADADLAGAIADLERELGKGKE